MPKYLMRFDDINPRIDWDKFFILKNILEKYNIKSILGVIPNCEDPTLMVSQPHKNYYKYLRKCNFYGDSIAQHGYKHTYESKSKGEFGSSNNSEFAGLCIDSQFKKLSAGKSILEKESLWEPIFMAPSHSFDFNTLVALKKLNFKIILDGFSLFPYKKNQLIFAPQISSKPLPSFIPGLSQLCIHINTISDNELNKIIKFIRNNHEDFISLKEIKPNTSLINLLDQKIIYVLITTFREFRKILIYMEKFKSKLECLFERFIYRFKFRNQDIYQWHLNGTFHCRNYKKVSLEIIESIKPKLFIDIGCGLGEILQRVSMDYRYKIGYDIDERLEKLYKKYYINKYKFFTKEIQLFDYIKKLNLSNNNSKVISMLNFIHLVSEEELNKMISKYYEKIGEYILLIDNIHIKEKKYKYDHHDLLYNHKGLFKYIHQVDKLRSLYCIKIGKI